MDQKKRQLIEVSIERQVDGNKSKNLFFINAGQVMDLEPGFLAALEELADSDSGKNPEKDFPEIIPFAAQSLLNKVNSVNRYLSISDQKVKELEEIYRQTWQMITTKGNLQNVLRGIHYPAISRWLATLYPEEFPEQLKFSPLVGHMVYEQYSAQMQVELLQLNLDHMKQPVIDIGCGSQANLVRYLHSKGIDAHGFYLHLEVQEAFLEQKDWFDYSFKPDVWGTVLSNMAFTNHLNSAQLHDASHLEQYLLKLREIIESLKIAGRFIYAPGLPFVENHFAPERYKMERKQVLGDIYVSFVTRTA
jgi:hypothetical protein